MRFIELNLIINLKGFPSNVIFMKGLALVLVNLHIRMRRALAHVVLEAREVEVFLLCHVLKNTP